MSIKIEQSYWRRAHFSPPLVDGSGEIATVAKVRYLTDYGNPTGYSQVLEQLDSSATSAEKDFIYGADLLAQADSGGGPAYLLGDHLGSTRLLTDAASGAITNTAFDYSPYGDPLGTSGSSLTTYPHAFTGQWRDETLGMQFHRARWMKATCAEWISKDVCSDFPGNFGNGYSYSGLNPIAQSDLSGKFTLNETLSVVSMIDVVVTPAINTYLNGGSAGDAFKASGESVLGIVQGLIIMGAQLGQFIVTLNPEILQNLFLALLSGYKEQLLGYIQTIKRALAASEYILAAVTFVFFIVAIIEIGKMVKGLKQAKFNNIRELLEKRADFMGRVKELANNAAEAGSMSLKEGVGGARYEMALGRKLRRSTEAGADFIDEASGEYVALKGPIMTNKGVLVPESQMDLSGFINSAQDDLKSKTFTKRLVIDTLGMSEEAVARVKREVLAAPNPRGKRIFFLESSSDTSMFTGSNLAN